MICRMDKNIYELLSAKIYVYVKDYVVAALAVNVTISYEDIQVYLKESSDNFGMEKIEQILECLDVTETKKIFEATCIQIPDLFLDLYEDILTCLGKIYETEITKDFMLDPNRKNALRYKIICILKKEASTFYTELDELNLIIDRLNILIANFSQPLNYTIDQKDKALDNLIIKFIAAWGNLINKYHVITNMYLDDIYPNQVEALYNEVMNSLTNNILDLLCKLLDSGKDLSKAHNMLTDYFNYLMDE